MAGNVEFKDFSMEVKAALNEATIAGLYEAASEVEAQTKRNVSTEGWTSSERTQLRDSYAYSVDESKGMATVGTPLEQGYWEEFGTGSHADTAKNGGKPGREGWWIYTPGSPGPVGKKSNTYATEEEAKDMAAYIRAKYGKEPVVTDGRDPHYTLERAFEASQEKVEDIIAKKLKESMEE